MKDHIPTAFAEYTQNRWIEPYKEKFASAYITHMQHYDRIFSPKNASANAAFKKNAGHLATRYFSSVFNHEDHLPLSKRKIFLFYEHATQYFSGSSAVLIFNSMGKY